MKKIIFAILILGSSLVINAQNLDDFKARYIINFANQTEWPTSYKTGDFIIGVLGTSPVTKSLQGFSANQKVGSQPIKVVLFSNVNTITKCNVLFVPSSQSKNLSKVLNKIGSGSTLIVTDKEGLAKQGAMLNFVLVNNKLNFEANKNNLSKNSLKITAYLEKLAILVN